MLSKSTLSICIGACLVTALPTLATVHASTANNVSIYAGDDPVIDPITKELLEGDAAREAIAQAQAQQSSNITITNKSQGAIAPARAAWTDLPADAPILPLGDEVVLEPAKNISIGEQNGVVIDSASAMVAAKEANTPVEKARRSIAVAQAQEEAQKKAQEAAKAQQEANEAQAKANAALAEQARARAAEIAMQNSTAASQGQSQTKADDNSTADAKAKIAKSEDKAVVAATSEQKTADESAKKRAKDRADAENVSKAIAAVKEHYNAPYDDKADKRLKDRSKDRVKSYGTNKTASEYQYVAKPMLPEKPAYKQAKVGTAWDPEKNRVTSYPSSIVTAATNAAAATASVNAAVIASAQSVPDHGPFKGTVTTLTQSQAATQNQAVTAEQQAQAQQQALAAQAPAQDPAPQGKAHGGSNLVAVGSSIEVPGTQDTSSAPVREQLVKVFGTNTPSMVGTVEEVAAYRKELANNQNVNYTNPPSVYTYTDQYGNVVTVENPNQYDVNYDIYLYDYIGSHGQLPPGWEGGYPPPGWRPPPGWVPPTGTNPPPGWPPNHPGWRPPPGWQPPAGWQPPPGWPPHYPGRPPSSSGPSYAPPPGMHEPQHPIMPGTPGWPADPGVHYVQPRK